jgi:HrpA-like RNA helicase
MDALPIDPLLPQVVAALTAASRLVLRAPPGAGKTTRVPAALLDAGVAGDQHVVVLEPRRIGARAAAEYVARARGSTVGGEVGYRVRFEQRGGPHTRLWFVTEGILGRQLTHDPFLEHVGLVVLDEFHERHLQGDVALAVVKELQETVRPHLKLVVMSATLDTDRIAAYLCGCPVLTSAGRLFPVRTRRASWYSTRNASSSSSAGASGFRISCSANKSASMSTRWKRVRCWRPRRAAIRHGPSVSTTLSAACWRASVSWRAPCRSWA